MFSLAAFNYTVFYISWKLLRLTLTEGTQRENGTFNSSFTWMVCWATPSALLFLSEIPMASTPPSANLVSVCKHYFMC